MMRRWQRIVVAVFGASILWVGTACAGESDDEFLRSYAECLADVNGVLHRTQFANRVGTVPLDLPGIERWLRVSLERGTISMDEMRANHNRDCK